jgi:ABC-type oligopeptide transport system substrate-binding subunit
MKKLNTQKKILLASCSMLLNTTSYSLSYHKPLPHDIDKIHKAKDICSRTISQSIHASLFTKKYSNNLSPYLIERYLISKNELVYKFKLKNLSFHDNTQLTAEIVKKNIEYSIKYNNYNYNLFSIIGAKDFFEGKQNSIQGIILDSKNSSSFTIALNENDPNLLEKLADQNLRILKPTREYLIGLGPYKIEEINEKKIVLVKFNHSLLKKDDKPDKIIYHNNTPKNIVLSGFNAGKFDDISLYDHFKDE